MGHCVSRNVDSGPPTESSSADSRSREASSSSNGDGGGGGGARRRCRGRGRSRGRSSWRREYERRRRQVMSPAGRDVSSSSSSEDSLSATVRKELLFKILVIGDYGVGEFASTTAAYFFSATIFLYFRLIYFPLLVYQTAQVKLFQY